MSKDSLNKNQVMTVGALKGLLTEFEVHDDFQVWLSSDEEGNDYLPMLSKPEYSVAIDRRAKKVTFFPSHR